LNPLLAASADVRVALCLRVWDVVKALKLTGAAAKGDAGRDGRAAMLETAERFFGRLDGLQRELAEVRAQVRDAEIVPRNEHAFGAIADLAQRLESLRAELWDAVERTGLLGSEVIASERVRELPV
jgi:hypothetical protein